MQNRVSFGINNPLQWYACRCMRACIRVAIVLCGRCDIIEQYHSDSVILPTLLGVVVWRCCYLHRLPQGKANSKLSSLGPKVFGIIQRMADPSQSACHATHEHQRMGRMALRPYKHSSTQPPSQPSNSPIIVQSLHLIQLQWS